MWTIPCSFECNAILFLHSNNKIIYFLQDKKEEFGPGAGAESEADLVARDDNQDDTESKDNKKDKEKKDDGANEPEEKPPHDLDEMD